MSMVCCICHYIHGNKFNRIKFENDCKIILPMRRRSSLLDESESDSDSDLLSPPRVPTPLPTGVSQDDTGFDPWDAPYLPQQNQKRQALAYGERSSSTNSSPVIEWIVVGQHHRDRTQVPVTVPLSPTQSLSPTPDSSFDSDQDDQKEEEAAPIDDPRSFRCGQPQCSDPPDAPYAFSSPSPSPSPPPTIDYYDEEDTRAVDIPMSPSDPLRTPQPDPTTYRPRPLPFPKFVDPSDEDTTSSESSDTDHDEWRLEREMLQREPIVIKPRTRPAAWLQRR
jgi:hypothetical protein